jgi:predicted  nucleic acid-binding Zn-ribbon protein
MIHPDFDPLALLEDITATQARLGTNQVMISNAFTELVNNFNDLNRRLCIQHNQIRELELKLNELREIG